MRKLLHRYGSINVPITSAGVIVYGLVLVIAPASKFAAPVFRDGPFEIVPQLAWGIAFIVAGVVGLALRPVWAVLPLLAVVTGWTISVVISSLTVDAVAPTAGIGWAIISTQLLTSVALRGTHNPAFALHQGWRR